MTRKLNRLFLPFVFATPACAYALGLGQLEVRSGLNQALDAEIELYSTGAEELASLSVGLASSEAFAQSNLDRAPGLKDLKFALDTRPDGRSFIKISSKQPIREPLLNFLVQLDWPKGALVREFAVLLDPPIFMARSTAQPRVMVPQRKPLTQAEANPTNSPSSGQAAASSDVTSAAAPTTAPVSGSYGPVAYGETLWTIADKLRPSPSISIPEMMNALLKANPKAFFKPNPDSLYAGATLTVPTFPNIVGEPVPSPQPEQLADATPLVETETEVADAENTPQVRLVSTEQDADMPLSEMDLVPETLAVADMEQSASSSAGRGGAIAAQYQIPLRDGRPELWVAGLDDLRSRIAPLVGVDDAALTAMKPPTVTPAESLPEVTWSDPVASESNAADARIDEPEQQPRPLQPVASGQDVAEPQATITSGVWDTLAKWRENPLHLALIAAGMLLASLAAALIARRRRRAQEAEVAEEVQFEAIAPDEPVTEAVVARGGPEPRVIETPAPPKIHPTPVSIERVNLLIAVGNYREAENTVRLALTEDPANIALNVKLLDIHAANGNTAAFLEEAELLHDRIDDKSDPRWLHVLDMGREFCPEDPMFGGSGNDIGGSDMVGSRGLGGSTPSEAALTTAVPDFRGASEPVDAELDADQVVADTLEGLEWQPPTREVSVDGAAANVGQQPDESEGDELSAHLDSLEFGIDDDETPGVVGAGQNDPQELDESPLFDPFTDDDGRVDDDLEAHLESLHFDAGPAMEDADSHGAVESATGDPTDDDDFVETKLDLAMAYLDMNDPVGARSLLEEVVDEGTDAQKRRAEELLRGVAA